MEKQNQEKTLGKTQQKLMPKNGVNIDYLQALNNYILFFEASQNITLRFEKKSTKFQEKIYGLKTISPGNNSIKEEI